MTKVFIDGQEGTTGLKIYERFSGRADIELIQIDEDKRKDPQERKKLINWVHIFPAATINVFLTNFFSLSILISPFLLIIYPIYKSVG